MTDSVTEKLVKEMLECVLDGHHLSEQESTRLLKTLTDPSLPPAVAGAVLAALRAKGVVAAELRGFAAAMRELARKPKVAVDLQRRSIDIVGTGGDASGSVNISTGTSLLVAACGAPVIKHGNRSISSRSGSADVLEALGLPLPLDEQRAGECLRATGFSFLFAPHYHPAMKAIAPIRQALGIRTIFNVLGPLTNPAAPPFQLVGAYSEPIAKLMAETLAGSSGVTRAFVVHGALGWDEPTTAGPFVLFDVRPGVVTRSVRSPGDYGMRTCEPTELAGGDAANNAAALRAVFEGRDVGAHRDTLLMGAALALECAGLVTSAMEGVARASAVIENGTAKQMLQRLAEFGRG
ncbi:MAG: anthranilate phosphoribosyltransferase [Gammaproteobacteria bacterium]|nr:anthranilate phosphoribosyltransferase [Gammaproteobacteria bacterium]